jgi:hypothetical protein
MIPYWPKTASMRCGCRVGLMREGQESVVLYFPCDPQCPTLEMTKKACDEVGKQWEKRNVNNN